MAFMRVLYILAMCGGVACGLKLARMLPSTSAWYTAGMFVGALSLVLIIVTAIFWEQI